MSKDTSPSTEEKRGNPRVETRVLAMVTIEGQRIPTRVYDISVNGAYMSRIQGVQLGALCRIDLPGYGVVEASIVRIVADKFAVTFPPDPELIAYLDDPEAVYKRLSSAAD